MRVGNGARGLMTDTARIVLKQQWNSYRPGKDLSLARDLAASLVEKGIAEYAEQNKSMATAQHRKAVRKKGAAR